LERDFVGGGGGSYFDTGFLLIQGLKLNFVGMIRPFVLIRFFARLNYCVIHVKAGNKTMGVSRYYAIPW